MMAGLEVAQIEKPKRAPDYIDRTETIQDVVARITKHWIARGYCYIERDPPLNIELLEEAKIKVEHVKIEHPDGGRIYQCFAPVRAVTLVQAIPALKKRNWGALAKETLGYRNRLALLHHGSKEELDSEVFQAILGALRLGGSVNDALDVLRAERDKE